MQAFRGNTSAVVTSEVFALPIVIENYTIVNRGAAAVGVSVYVISGANQFPISPTNKQVNAGDYFTDVVPRIMLATEQIKIQPSGDIGYYFSLENAPIVNDGTAD